MKKPYILSITEEEKAHLQWLANTLGISIEEVITQSIIEALEENRTGVHDAYEQGTYE